MNSLKPARPSRLSALVIDYGFEPGTPGELRVARDLHEARDALQDPWVRYAGIFLDAGMGPPGVIELLREARVQHPATPIFFIYERQPPLDASELSRITVIDQLPKPLSTEQILRLTQLPPGLGLDADDPLATEAGVQASADQSDEAFVPVLIEEFLSGHPSFFNVHRRASDVEGGQYTRLIRARETLDPARARELQDQGHTHLYIEKAAFTRGLEYCESLGRNLAQRPGASLELKLLNVIGSAQSALETIEACIEGGAPLPEDELERAGRSLTEMRPLLDDPARGATASFVDELFRQTPLLEHSMLVAMLAVTVGHRLGITSRGAVMQLSMASLLHDVGLLELPEMLRVEHPVPPLEEARELLATHPARSARILRVSESLDEATLQAVALHHEHRSAGGLPLMAEIIGICDELAHRMALVARTRRGQLVSRLGLLAEMRTEAFPSYSARVVQAVDELLGAKNP